MFKFQCQQHQSIFHVQDGTGGSHFENRLAKAAIEKRHLLSNKMQSFTKIGLLKTLGQSVRCDLWVERCRNVKPVVRSLAQFFSVRQTNVSVRVRVRAPASCPKHMEDKTPAATHSDCMCSTEAIPNYIPRWPPNCG